MSPADFTEFCRVFPHHSNEELAKMFGVKRSLVEAYGTKHQLRKTAETLSTVRGRNWSADDIAYLREHYPTGNTEQIARHLDKTYDQVQNYANKNGIFKVRSVRQQASSKNAGQKKAHVMPGWNGANDAKDRGARLTAEQRAKLPPVGMDTAKRTVLTWKGYDDRYQCDPAAKVYGAGFASLGPGRYLDEQGVAS